MNLIVGLCFVDVFINVTQFGRVNNRCYFVTWLPSLLLSPSIRPPIQNRLSLSLALAFAPPVMQLVGGKMSCPWRRQRQSQKHHRPFSNGNFWIIYHEAKLHKVRITTGGPGSHQLKPAYLAPCYYNWNVNTFSHFHRAQLTK